MYNSKKSRKTAKNWNCLSPVRQQVCKPLPPVFWMIMYSVNMFFACVFVQAWCASCNERKKNCVPYLKKENRNPTKDHCVTMLSTQFSQFTKLVYKNLAIFQWYRYEGSSDKDWSVTTKRANFTFSNFTL